MDRSEAIEALKDFWSVYAVGTEIREAFETLIPELKESEDETIRKELVGFIQDEIDSINRLVSGDYDDRDADDIAHQRWCEKVLAWIKKQGEHIKFLKSIQIGDEVTRNPDGVLVNLSQFKRKAEQGSQNLANSAKTCKDEPKFKVKYAGSEYNVLEVKDIAGVTYYGIEDEPNHIDYVQAENCERVGGYSIKENGSPYPTKPAMFSEQNPAWSEEDEGIVSQIMTDLENCESEWGSNKDEEKDWLESLKGRVQPQPKSEWSENDEKMIGRIRGIIERYAFSQSAVDVNGDLCEREFIEPDEWLRTLKERYTWKPSDEQMEYLAKAITTLGDEGDNKTSAILYELRTDLKKLKG